MTPELTLPAGEGGSYWYVVLIDDPAPLVRLSDTDRSEFCDVLKDSVFNGDASIHAYCALEHSRLLVMRSVSAHSLGRTIGEICEQYARRINGVAGCALAPELSFQSVQLHLPSELLATVRHCQRGPLHSGLTPDPVEYRWSSALAYEGKEKTAWLTRSTIAGLLAQEPGGWPCGYRRLMAELEEGESSPNLVGTEVFILPISGGVGDQACLEWLRSRPAGRTIERIIDAVLSLTDCDRVELLLGAKEPRIALAHALIAWYTTQVKATTFTAVAKFLGRDRSRLHKSVGHNRELHPELFELSLDDLFQRAASVRFRVGVSPSRHSLAGDPPIYRWH
jgi:hypothetical protein